jgi:ribulose-phosphate 3-epimerase
MSDFIISASILSADFAHLHDQIKLAETAGVDWLHIDVMDGSFVPNISMGPFIVETCNRISDLPLDVHLMIEHPEKHIETFAKAGADNITVHVENNPNLHRTLQEIRAFGCRAGVAINPGTSIFSLDAVLNTVDLILVMSVNPGFSGQKYIPESAQKTLRLKQNMDIAGSKAFLEVDGGMNDVTLPLIKNAGANVFVTANYIFRHPEGVVSAVNYLRKAGS